MVGKKEKREVCPYCGKSFLLTYSHTCYQEILRRDGYTEVHNGAFSKLGHVSKIKLFSYYVVLGIAISVDEAKLVKQEQFQYIGELLKDISKRVNYIIKKKQNEIEQNILDLLNNIQTQLENALKEVRKVNLERPIGTSLEERMKDIIELFEKVRLENGTNKLLISPEMNAIIAHSKIKWVKDAEAIIERPEKALSIIYPIFPKYINKVITEFGARFPFFQSYRVQTKGTCINLKDGPSDQDVNGRSVLDSLLKTLEAFLGWELRKIGIDMKVIFEVIFNSEYLERVQGVALDYQIKCNINYFDDWEELKYKHRMA